MRPCAWSAPRVSPLHRRGCLSCWSTAPCLPFIPSRDVTRDAPPALTGGAARLAPAPRLPGAASRPVCHRPPRQRATAWGGERPQGRGGLRAEQEGAAMEIPTRAEWYGRAREPTDADILIWDTSCARGRD